MSKSTQVGIHKDDIIFSMNNFPIKKIGSQGQQKSFLIAIILFLNLQYSLLLSENSYFSYKNTKEMQQLIMSDINDLSDSNRILKGEISDLTNNENSIELYAREKFGYIKKRESFVQIIKNDQK